MQVFIRLLNGLTIAYEITNENDKGILLKRYIADYLKYTEKNRSVIYKMRLIYGGVNIQDNDSISEKIPQEGTIHIAMKITSGASQEKTESCYIYYNGDMKIKYAPNSMVAEVLADVLERLIYQGKVDRCTTIDNVYLKLGNKVLDPRRYVAEYPELSKSFLMYNLQDNFINQNSIYKKLIKHFGDYYQVIPIGNRKETTDNLVFCIGKVDGVYDSVYNCALCNSESFHILLPCCRKRSCYKCIIKADDRNKCLNCNTNFD